MNQASQHSCTAKVNLADATFCQSLAMQKIRHTWFSFTKNQLACGNGMVGHALGQAEELAVAQAEEDGNLAQGLKAPDVLDGAQHAVKGFALQGVAHHCCAGCYCAGPAHTLRHCTTSLGSPRTQFSVQSYCTTGFCLFTDWQHSSTKRVCRLQLLWSCIQDQVEHMYRSVLLKRHHGVAGLIHSSYAGLADCQPAGCAVLCHTVLCCAAVCSAMLCYAAMCCYVALCCAIPCRAGLCYAVLQ